MSDLPERTSQTEDLYARGLEHLRGARWDEAVRVLSELRVLSNAYPEIDTLIADALLKIEVERTNAPDAVAPPRRSRLLRPRFIGPIVALLVIGAALLIAIQPASVPAQLSVAPTSAISLPTPAPTNTPRPTATPEPTATSQPTATPLPTATPEPTTIAEPGTLVVQAAGDQPLVRTIGNIEIILDASGSMRAKIGDRRKIDIAHESLAALIGQLPEQTNVALRAYGHRKGNDCNDVELVVPLSPLDRTGLIGRIGAVNPAPNGMTPIGASLQQVAEDLKDAKGDSLVVLVSDGEETCNSDPAQIAAQLRASNPRLKIDVIGFDVGADLQARLSAIAQGGSGSYFDAADATQLVAALQQAVALTYRVLDAQGTEVYHGTLGSSTTLPAGHYTVVVGGDSALTIGDVEVGGGRPATVELREQDGTLTGTVVTP
jgi:Ca-activated chloride channel homolog